MLDRGQLGQQHYSIFKQSQFYEQKFGPDILDSNGKEFYQQYENFVQQLWAKDNLLQEQCLVHDAIYANFFLDGNRVTAIDVSSDYVGSVGHEFSIMLSRWREPRAARRMNSSNPSLIFSKRHTNPGRDEN